MNDAAARKTSESVLYTPASRNAGNLPRNRFPTGLWLARCNAVPIFFPTFARVSDAIQTTLRQRIPTAYFENARNFTNVKTAYPMLVYQASRPFPREGCGLNSATMF